ncbi:MAG: methyltransferase domain-containing protein [Calditrichaeota bacterium]|nr:MAG: methyltransferase domain-containing protein [Calditrichota bacterium]
MTITVQNKEYKISRYPETKSTSLHAWSAADEHIIKYVQENEIVPKASIIYNDRFGYLSCMLNELNPFVVINYKSQEKACHLNLRANNLPIAEEKFLSPLAPLPKNLEIALIKIPKSLDLFRMFLNQLSAALTDEAIVVCAFMTRHFTPGMLNVAAEFFEESEQSKAWKKSRLLILRKKKTPKEISLLNSIKFNDSINLRQYFGVFSAGKIDNASLLFIDRLKIKTSEERVLDLGSGNGVLSMAVREQNINCELHLIDDSFLAVESSKLNLAPENTYFYYNDCLDNFKDHFFDLVVSNPPFHFEHENNIEISLALFKAVKRCLKKGGRFLLVANRHINYKTHLLKMFKAVKINAGTKKIVLYECSK